MSRPSNDEEVFLSEYDPRQYDRPSTAVDTAIFTIREDQLQVLLIKREEHPFLGRWSLVGGYVDMQRDSDLESTAKRKLLEKTGIATSYLEQVITVGNRERDPRGWTLSTVYFALLPWKKIQLRAGAGADDVSWVPLNKVSADDLAFDHWNLLEQSLERLRSKTLYTTLPVNLMEGEFTLSELQQTYETILDKPMQAKSFRRRIEASGAIIESGNMRATGKRPAQLYLRNENADTHFFARTMESLK
ncbi:MAG: NUDIX domain-containing protein [Verrucomicrobiota bacterium]